MDPKLLDFVSLVAVAAAGVAGFGITVSKVPLPEKVPWGIGFLIVAVNAILNILYSLGGYYTILFPVLFMAKSVQETTGALAFLVGSYSALHKGQISAHWYSVPFGCTPVAMAAQYVPSQLIESALFAAFALYVLAKFGQDSLGKKILAPIALVLTSVAVTDYLQLPVRYANGLVAVAVTFFIAVATKKDISIGKTKVL